MTDIIGYSKQAVQKIVDDIHKKLKTQCIDELRYSLPNEEKLIVEVLADTSGDGLSIAVERYGKDDLPIECIQDDYDCSDSILTAMLECALLDIGEAA